MITIISVAAISVAVMSIAATSVAVLITLQIRWKIKELSKDIRDLNRIIKRLQAENKMIADGIDKAGK